jgi:hypothetical protein
MSTYFIDTNSKQITFTDNRFYRTENGRSVPSVTTILQAYPKDAHFFQWLKQVGEEADNIRDEAGRRGSIVHTLTERYDAGEEITILNPSGEIGYKLNEWAMFERYVDFRNCHPLEIIHSEFNVISEKLNFAGTIDRVITLNGKNYLIDIKTSNAVHEFYWLQLQAYKRLLWEYYDSDKVVDGVAILWLNAKTRTYGKADAIQGPGWQLLIRDKAEESQDWELFKATQLLWSAQNQNLKPRELTYKLAHKI